MDKVIITGATGFIGSHIVQLFHENKVPVSCLVRKTSSLDNIKGFDVACHYGDICDVLSLIEAFQGHDVVIHNAAYVHDWGEYDLFYSINVAGTVNVLHACIANNIRHIIFTGSCSSYGEEDSSVVKDESSPFKPHYDYFLDKIFPSKMNYYRETKAAGTKKAIAIARENNLNLTILEPVWVFGEREFSSGFFEYIQSVKQGIFAVPGSGKNKFHVIYAHDCARAFFLAYKKKLKGVERILIGNREPAFMGRIYFCFLKYAGLKIPFHLPKWVIYPVAFFMELIFTLFKIKKSPVLTRARVNMFYDNIEYSVKKADTLLGFKNDFSLEEGICRTISWYKQNNYI